MTIETSRQARTIAWGGAISFVVAMGFGRFAFTPALPMMLHDHVIDLKGGSFLATLNYLGYLLGALICMGIPWTLRRFHGKIPSHPAIVRSALAATTVLILGMSFSLPALWPWLRLLTGMTSAIAFVYTSGWCLEQLIERDALSLSGIIYTGPGIGIVISGLASIVMTSLHFSSAAAWVGFAFLATLFTALIWNLFREDKNARAFSKNPIDPVSACSTPWGAEPLLLALAYGLAGFGYIITATFLPVIAREVIPHSPWINFFWPIFGASVVVGAFLAQKIPATMDRRSILFGSYVLQFFGIFLVLFFPTQWGFVLGSIFVGFPFNIISLFGMQEARRLRPVESTTFMGLLTAAYGIGQMLGPAVVTHFLCACKNHAEGFSLSLKTAAASLLVGALLYWLMKIIFPLPILGQKNK